MKALLKQLLPPIVTDAWRRRGHPRQEPVTFSGDYASWSAALHDSAGYDSPLILERTRAALAKVRDGEAVFERDALLLAEPELPLPLLAGLLRAAAANAGRLHVLDFGGSLGSTYFQCRGFLRPLAELRWSVVEQPAHVACGNAEFAGGPLAFYPDLAAALAAGPRPQVLLLSSVLQYLPDPHGFLRQALALRLPHVIVDRTAFHAGDRDRLTVQRVPAWIYPASYPAWFFSEPGLRAHFADAYEPVATFPAIDQPELPGTYACTKGLIYQLRP